jgi:hypothetical protein
MHNRLGFELARGKEEAWRAQNRGAPWEKYLPGELTSLAYK